MELVDPSTGIKYLFNSVPLNFDDAVYSDAFVGKNNKTLNETLLHAKYAKLAQLTLDRYSESFSTPLGTFLGQLKANNDSFYKRFLNRYGDSEYSVFRVGDPHVESKRGIYAYCIEGDLRYIGRCRDSMKKRINLGYGRIHPKNCYLDGQATNCRLNALITQARQAARLWFCELHSLSEIESGELGLIRAYDPPWNLQHA